jgi:4-hydroxy-2-oxoheptanedioate aldolase
VLVFQIESPEALEQVEQIAAVPGFDGLLFGPGDFSHLIGKAGRIHEPEVVAARQRVAAVARAHGKFAMSAGLFAPRSVLEAEGHNVFNLGADVLGLGDYFRSAVAGFAASPAAP